MKSTFVFVIFMIVGVMIFGQSSEMKSNIRGNVIDVETQQPLPFSSVWIDGTTMGCSADANGNFTLKNVSAGRYTLVAGILGYEQKALSEIAVVPNRVTWVTFELKPTATNLDEVVIHSGFFNQNTDKALNSITTIDYQEIKRTPGVPDMFRRLQSVAGITRVADNSPQLIVRGGAPDENLTIIENIEIYSPFHFSSLGGAMAEGVSIIQPKIINDVVFLTGGFNSQFGDKLSSVTDIHLKQPSKESFTTDLTLDMSGFGAIVEGSVSSKASWLMSGRRGVYDLMMKLRHQKTYPRTLDLHGKFIYEPNTKNKFTFYGLWVEDDIEKENEEDEDESGNQMKYGNVSKSMSAMGVTWKYLYSVKGYLQVTPFFNTNNWRMTQSRTKDSNENGEENQEDFWGIKTSASYRLNQQFRITAGGEFKRISASYKQWSAGDTLPTGLIETPFNVKFGPEKTLKTAAYLHLFYSPYDWLQINSGLRYDYFQFTNQSVISPRAGINFKVSDKISMNASTGLFAQYPPFYNIFLSQQNAGLKTNKSIHYIIGTEYLVREDFQIKVEGFFKDMKDLTVVPTDTSKVFYSSGTGCAQGIELTLTKKMSKNLYFLCNYTWSKSVRKDAENAQEYLFEYDSPHCVNILSTYKSGKWWNFSLSGRYSTGLPYTPYDVATRKQVDGIWYCSKGPKNSERLPDYLRLDVRVDYLFIFRNFNLGVFLEVWNITNHENPVSYDYSDDFLTKEPVVLFPIMPMLGFTAEF